MSAPRLSDSAAPPRAVLDSDVIFSRVLHDLFGRLATGPRLFTLIWSDELLAEARSALMRRKPMSAEVADRWVGYLSSSFPAQRVSLHGRDVAGAVSAATTDPDDAHVCALAIAGHAKLLITADRGYLADELRRHGVTVVTPDSVLASTLDQHEGTVLEVLDAQAAAWAGGRPVEELLDAIERAGAVTFAARARELLAS
jgi:predicted nucleic acid-binding protein